MRRFPRIILFGLMWLVSGIASGSEPIDGIAIVLNGTPTAWSQVFFEYEVFDRYQRGPSPTPFLGYIEGQSVRDSIVNRTLLIADLGLGGETLAGEARMEQEARVREFSGAFGGEVEMTAFLAAHGRTMEDVRGLIGECVAIDAALRRRHSVDVKDEEVRHLYDVRYGEQAANANESEPVVGGTETSVPVFSDVSGALRAELLEQRFDSLIRQRIAQLRNRAEIEMPSSPWGGEWKEPKVSKTRYIQSKE